ncbi:MAG: excinuclease ABC subunit UvrA [Verrucomicrobiales bacterium]|nr:excinuclease ABC subunit UvrA [Verrucomicrobiales bacterium]
MGEISQQPKIKIVGARQHNLKNIDVEIPRNQLVVITGVSGSGKSSLAFDTLYAEGQRRYVESLSAYARQFLDQLEKPEVDFIEGLTPAIAIEQRGSGLNPRSTIATTTEIYDYLRILYAALGQPHDPKTGAPLVRHTIHDIVEMLTSFPERTKIVILAPTKIAPDEAASDFFDRLKKQGFLRLRIKGGVHEIDDLDPDKYKKLKDVQVVIDRLVIREDIRSRLADSLETTLKISETRVTALVQEPDADDFEQHDFTTTFTNPATGFSLPVLTPKHFSFNSHLGACPDCHGLGTKLSPDPELFVPDPDKSIAAGGIKTWWTGSKSKKGYHQRGIEALAKEFDQDLGDPIRKMSKDFKRALFYGTDGQKIGAPWNKEWEGLSVQAHRLLETSKSEMTKRNVRRFMSARECKTCEGRRLKDSILSITMPHESDPRSIEEFARLSIGDAVGWLDGITLTEQQKTYAGEVLKEIGKRLEFLNEVGLSYLSLDRQSGTLSGGESQRIRLATQLGAGLAGVLYVLDEPSIGLHQSDNEKLIATLKTLRDKGNSVIVVEHDEDTIREADWLLDLGPGAGENGGELLAIGTPDEVEADPKSVTGEFLSGIKSIELPAQSSLIEADSFLTVRGAREHNLKDVDAKFPLGAMTCVTGVSGSGKSTLVDTILRRALFKHFHNSKDKPGDYDKIEGLDLIDKVIVIDQSPIGRSPRSNPATYIGVFGPIRDLFAQLPISRTRGYEAGRFSFNVAGGRCEACQGDGLIKIDMHFLSDVYVTCEACGGRRYNRETLDATFRGKNIADILEMTANEAREFFQKVPKIHQLLKALCDVGLGYVRLGQSATTLSGGEAQRIKLASELGKTSTGNTLYLLDEPTTGLHFADIATLLEVFYRLREAGNTLIVIEHNLDVIKCADWVIDLGPGGGASGGEIIAEGTPDAVSKNGESKTGNYLKRYFP